MLTMTPLLLSSLALLTQTSPALFEDVTTAVIGEVPLTCGSQAKNAIVEVNGGGLALEDFDGDGWLDLVVVDGSTLERVEAGEPGNPARLFLGRPEGKFVPAPEAWAMAPGRWGVGAATGDVNGDGWPDLLLIEWGPDRLFINRAGEGFEEVTDKAGLTSSGWSTSASFGDFDGDGVLDLFVAGYLEFDPKTSPRRSAACTWKGHGVMCGPEGFVATADHFYHGLGDGRFVDRSTKAGLRSVAAAFALGVAVFDHELDGDLDLYIANDSTPNYLLLNDGEAHFKEIGLLSGVGHDRAGREQAGMGVVAQDFDGDGRCDLFVTNFSGESNAFYASHGPRGYRERSGAFGLGGPSTHDLGWGTVGADFDLDGDADLAVCNGHVYPEAARPGTDTSYAQPDRLYVQASGHFTPTALSDGPDRVSRATVAGDLDRDGDLDLLVWTVDGGLRVLHNRAVERGAHRALRVSFARPKQARSDAAPRIAIALGTRLTWSQGKASGTQLLHHGGGFQASGPAELLLTWFDPKSPMTVSVLRPGDTEPTELQVLPGTDALEIPIAKAGER